VKTYLATFDVPATKKAPAYIAQSFFDVKTLTEAKELAASKARQLKITVRDVKLAFKVS
jgi:hypothetical protein